MKLFIDSADPKEIKHAWQTGVVDGVTTNPSLAAKVGKPYKEIVEDIFSIVDGPVSLEVVATDFHGMMDQAHALASLNPNAVVKIPCIQEGIAVVKQLTSENIKTNVTLVFRESQALLAAKAGATYVSPFAGRLDDMQSGSGANLLSSIRTLYDNFGYETEILAASMRNVEHVEMAALVGCDVATIPYGVLMDLVTHKLTDSGLERFLKDWNESGLELPV